MLCSIRHLVLSTSPCGWSALSGSANLGSISSPVKSSFCFGKENSLLDAADLCWSWLDSRLNGLASAWRLLACLLCISGFHLDISHSICLISIFSMRRSIFAKVLCMVVKRSAQSWSKLPPKLDAAAFGVPLQGTLLFCCCCCCCCNCCCPGCSRADSWPASNSDMYDPSLSGQVPSWRLALDGASDHPSLAVVTSSGLVSCRGN
mmetsp:Transcript_44072/g.84638  ORF Transcript_44072/g.84638 Transcript_44072/m.84638 type:complete len:205 (+) Transcript_44072:158-772(+)